MKNPAAICEVSKLWDSKLYLSNAIIVPTEIFNANRPSVFIKLVDFLNNTARAFPATCGGFFTQMRLWRQNLYGRRPFFGPALGRNPHGGSGKSEVCAVVRRVSQKAPANSSKTLLTSMAKRRTAYAATRSTYGGTSPHHHDFPHRSRSETY